ncbi:hypothetical protein PybrP1_006441 [[Pythium] brassicae (nom. inval.)]|nr:hypothetical protein PybrP1_006441 [[Pythium] brassicae (nom. inval.)]
MATLLEEDDVGMLLQTYDALDSFLREMDALDVKEELLQLREQALAMEAQLQNLQSARATAHAPKLKASSVETQLWERCAVVERRAKHAVEGENARLRDIASKELKVSFEIEKLLVKCYASAAAFVPFGKNAELALEARDLALYEMLEGNADARFRAIASAKFEFAAPVMAHASSHESRIVLTGNQETGVEFTRSQLFPFDSESVNEVSWNTIVKDDHNMFTAKHVRHLGDMIAIHARITVRREGEDDIHLDAHNVIKRFRQKKRVTITWEGMSQWTIAGSKALILPTRETGWGVLEPVAGAAQVTQSQFCSAFVSTKAQGVAMAPSEANLLRDLIIPSIEQLMVSRHQLMENALLDASLRRK